MHGGVIPKYGELSIERGNVVLAELLRGNFCPSSGQAELFKQRDGQSKTGEKGVTNHEVDTDLAQTQFVIA